jgi:dihydrofolate reductase
LSKHLEICIIAAVTKSGVIGKEGTIPWRLAEDRRRFKALTMGYPCIMGRKTWESLPHKPLPGRDNIIISTTLKNDNQRIKICGSFDSALDYCRGKQQKVYICGGAAAYQEALPAASRMELTVVYGDYAGDACFPDYNREDWIETARQDAGEFAFISLRRVSLQIKIPMGLSQK